MPLITVTSAWSAAIPVTQGDAVHNQGRATIYVCPGDVADRGNSWEVPPGKVLKIDQAQQVFLATLSRRNGLGRDQCGERRACWARRRGLHRVI